MTSYNVSSHSDAQNAFTNSGWIERFDVDGVEDRAATFIRQNCSADHIDQVEFDDLMARFAVEKMGWSKNDL